MNKAEMREISWMDQVGQSRLNAAVEAEELGLFLLLKPAIYRDGNQWCVLYGENIQDGICGFGNTPLDAIRAFNMDWGKGELK